MSNTHITNITGRIRLLRTPPSDPQSGEMFYDIDNNSLFRYTGNNWIGFHFSGAATGSSVPPENLEGTHFSSLIGTIREATANPTDPKDGDWFYNTSTDALTIYVNGAWLTASFTTTTSTSTSSTTTSTSTSTTSTSTSTTTSTSTSTSSSTSTTTTF